MRLDDARVVAEEIMTILGPSCDRLEIAGSIRRRKPEVKDIELVAVPKYDTAQIGLFDPTPVNVLENTLADLKHRGGIQDRLDKNGRSSWGERYKRALWRAFSGELVPLDLFIVEPPAQWGVIMAIRTGSSDFSRNFMTEQRYGGRMPSHFRVIDGALWEVDPNDRDEKIALIETPEEHSFFTAIGYHDFPAPEDRI